MHEVSVAQSVVDLVEKEAKAAEAILVTSVELDIGSLSGVETEALEFAWEMVVKDTLLARAELQINYITARARCKECSSEFDSDNYFTPCPSCGSFSFDVYQGRELQVKSFNIET